MRIYNIYIHQYSIWGLSWPYSSIYPFMVSIGIWIWHGYSLVLINTWRRVIKESSELQGVVRETAGKNGRKTMKPLWFLSRCTLREMAMSITSNSLPIHFGDVLWSGSGFHNPRMLLLFLTGHSFFQVNNPCFLRGFVWISLDPIVFFCHHMRENMIN